MTVCRPEDFLFQRHTLSECGLCLKLLLFLQKQTPFIVPLTLSLLMKNIPNVRRSYHCFIPVTRLGDTYLHPRRLSHVLILIDNPINIVVETLSSFHFQSFLATTLINAAIHITNSSDIGI